MCILISWLDWIDRRGLWWPAHTQIRENCDEYDFQCGGVLSERPIVDLGDGGRLGPDCQELAGNRPGSHTPVRACVCARERQCQDPVVAPATSLLIRTRAPVQRVHPPPNKQLQRIVIRRRGDGASAISFCARAALHTAACGR